MTFAQKLPKMNPLPPQHGETPTQELPTMSRSPSRLDRAEHPPMSRAIRRIMNAKGIPGMELVRALDGLASQSTVSRYYIEREPDYIMAGHIEDALGVPRGTLFSLAGYVPMAMRSDSLAAVMNDERLTDRQKATLVKRLLDSLRHDAPISSDAFEAVMNDPRLLEKDRHLFAELIQTFLETNELLAEKEAAEAPKKPTPRKRSKV